MELLMEARQGVQHLQRGCRDLRRCPEPQNLPPTLSLQETPLLWEPGQFGMLIEANAS